MKVMWCWRCRMDVPMLDEAEYAEIQVLHRAAFHAAGKRMHERFLPVCEAYERITGVAESNVNAIAHHRISLYGRICQNCGKPLRTPRARFCAACGTAV